ncbi:MAG: S8 family serine peptidase [Frankiaceae bacterium]
MAVPSSLVVLAAAALLPAGLPSVAAAAAAGGTAKHAGPRHPVVPTGFHVAPSIASGKTATGEPNRTGSTAFPSHGPVTVMLQLDARAVAQAYATARPHGATAALSAARSQRAAVASLTRSVQSHLTAPATRATTLFTLHNVYAGIAVRTDASRIAALGRIPGVAVVRAMPVKHLDNASSVPLIGAPDVWSSGTPAGTGKGVRIGIIDTGIDYTHANFGGTGNKRAYEADHRVSDAPTLNVPSGDFPSAKVVGGTDFVGDAYDASSDNKAVATPHPDPNPLDCNGHGSHVAGTAAGYGVDNLGHTFTGDYSSLAGQNLEPQFRIGPGVAPGASLYALRVFGCAGSTNVVSKALDWAADPNGDGNFNDHLDVVNMSLGSDFGAPDDPDSVASNNAALLGITVVASIGNNGDLVDTGGSPGNASRVLAVAASQDQMTIYDAMRENAPGQRMIPGQFSVAYDWANNGPTTGDVAAVDPTFDPNATDAYSPDHMKATNADGCDPFTAAQAARVKGKIAWLEWTDNDALRRCGSVGRSGNARAAGAIGALFTDDRNAFSAGITGDAVIPVFQIRKVDSDALRPAAQAGTLNVTLSYDFRNSVRIDDPNSIDQIADFSSRGIRAANNGKPDVTAPGVSIFSTAIGTGNEGMNDTGTSMAAPHVTGTAALVKAAHPTWFPEQIKAAIMNTADHSVFATPADARNASTDREAPQRVGAGRVDAAAAVADDVLAYSFLTNGAVSISFGPVQVTGDTSITRQFKLENDGSTSQTYALAFRYGNNGTHPPGVSYAFPSTVTVPAASTITVPVTISIDRSALARRADTTRTIDLGSGAFNNFTTDADGWLRLLQSGTEKLRLPVYASVRPASAMHAAGGMTFGSDGTATVPLAGTGVDQDDYQSIVSGYQLGIVSPQKPACTATSGNPLACTAMPSDAAGDVRYVGAASDAPLLGDAPDAGLTYFAVTAAGQWRTPVGYVEYDVNIDTNGDGKADLVLFNTRFDGTDYFVSALVDATTGDVVDDGNALWLLNGADGSVDTNPFDNSVMVLPVLTKYLTAAAPSGRIQYWVDASTISSGPTDHTAKATFNVLHPGLTVVDGPLLSDYAESNYFGGEQFWKDVPTGGATPPLTVLRNRTSYAAQHGMGLLLLHHYNRFGSRVEVVRTTASVTFTVSPNPTHIGQRTTATVTVSGTAGATPTGRVWLTDGGGFLPGSGGTLSGGKATVRLPLLTFDLRSLAASYGGDASYSPSSSAPIHLKVIRAVSTVSWSTSSSSSTFGQPVTFHIKVAIGPGLAKPEGSVQVIVDGTVRATRSVPFDSGKTWWTTSSLSRGTHRVQLHYLGNSAVAPDWYSAPFTVR